MVADLVVNAFVALGTHALAVLGCASAFAFSEGDSPARAALLVRIADEGASASFDPEGPAPPLAFEFTDGAWRSPPLPLPIDGYVTLRAKDRTDERFRIAYGRAAAGTVDLGTFHLGAGTLRTLVVLDDARQPIAGAILHRVDPESRFPPRDPRDRSARTILNDDHFVGLTDDRGEIALSVGESSRRFVVSPPHHALEFVELSDESTVTTVVASKGTPLVVAVRCESPRLIDSGRVLAFFDLGGVGFERECPVNDHATVLLDRDRPVDIVVEARGMKSARLSLDAIPADPVTIELDAIDLRFARLTVRGQATRESLVPDSIRLGRARANPREYPRRVDFAPDWNSFRVGADEPPLLAAPPPRVDLSISAPGHRETIVRGLRFEGTIDDPTPLELDLPGVLPIAGRVIDRDTRSPIPLAIVTVRRSSRDLEDLPLAWRLRGTVGFVAAIVADERGRFRIESSAYEDLVVEVEAEGYATRTFGPFPRDTSHALDLAMDRGFVIAGAVRDPEPGDVVLAYDRTGPRIVIASLDERGGFSIPALPSGDYVLVATEDPRADLAKLDAGLDRSLESALGSSDAIALSLSADRVDLSVPRVGRLNR